MLFEGAFRLICAHPSENLSKSRSPVSRDSTEPIEQDFTYKLTGFSHVSRHLEILNLMVRDIEALIIPREDYLKKLKLGLSKITSSLDPDAANEEKEDDNTMHPGMLYIINDILYGPILTAQMLLPTLISILPTNKLQTEAHPDLNHVLNIHKCVEQLKISVTTMLSGIKEYLEHQSRNNFYYNLASTYISNPRFQEFSRSLPSDIFDNILTAITLNHGDELKKTMEFITILENMVI